MLEFSSPVGQIYINHDDIETTICINNFFSFLFPDYKCSSLVDYFLVNSSGATIYKSSFELPYNGSKFFSLREILLNEQIATEIGSIYLSAVPKSDELLNSDYAGKITSHFYTQYKSLINGSIALVHPQATMNSKPFTALSWKSSYLIDTNNIKNLRFYQCNHRQENTSVLYSLFDLNENLIIEKRLDISHLASSYVEFSKEELGQTDVLKLIVDRLPCGNSKPLVMKLFENDTFSILHG